jgi:hypothetical protein
MGFLNNLRTRFAAPSGAQPPIPTSPNADAHAFSALPDNNYQPVVGESHYQPALAATARVCRPGEDGRPMFRAYLLAEPENAYDRDAIAVHGDHGKLGHLSREDAQRYKATITELAARGYAGATCAAFLNGGEREPPNYGVVLKLAHPETCEQHLGLASPSAPRRTARTSSSAAASKSDAGTLRGKHYTEYAEEVRVLRRYEHDKTAETLLVELLDVIEAESANTGWGVAPWYYEQLAIIYRKRKDYAAEVKTLERFASAPHAPGSSPPKLLERLDKARALAAKSR